MESCDHLFRREAGRMVATLTRIFGVHNLELAEDVVQDAFCRALEVWKYSGLPENPSAWLMATAKNRALDVLRRERTARTYAPELGRLLHSEWTAVPVLQELFEPSAVKDDQLRMMFSCCHPRLPEASQVQLVLHLLCGFSVGEIASAFMSGHDAIEKRLTRAKKILAGSKKLFEVSQAEDFSQRLPAVQRAIYLLFNEGYHSASPDAAVRADLCHEAMRLVSLLLDHPPAATPAAYALAALMRLHAGRLPARLNDSGNLSPLADQDRSRWDPDLIAEGERLLDFAASGPELTEYHLEAAIAAIHAMAPSMEKTDWEKIVALYDLLMQVRASPVVALNRAIAIAQVQGPARGIEEIRRIERADLLSDYPFFHAALGEFEIRCHNYHAAREHFQAAERRARNPAERQFYEQRIRATETEGAQAPSLQS